MPDISKEKQLSNLSDILRKNISDREKKIEEQNILAKNLALEALKNVKQLKPELVNSFLKQLKKDMPDVSIIDVQLRACTETFGEIETSEKINELADDFMLTTDWVIKGSIGDTKYEIELSTTKDLKTNDDEKVAEISSLKFIPELRVLDMISKKIKKDPSLLNSLSSLIFDVNCHMKNRNKQIQSLKENLKSDLDVISEGEETIFKCFLRTDVPVTVQWELTFDKAAIQVNHSIRFNINKDILHTLSRHKYFNVLEKGTTVFKSAEDTFNFFTDLIPY